MNRIEGISEVYSYGKEGGIALFSNEPPEGAISGGSGNEGTQTQATRIRWWILKNPDGSYSGGITGVGWFQNVSQYGQSVDGPFDGVTEDEIYETAERDKNLNYYFGPWNSEHSNPADTTIQLYVAHLKERGAAGCVMEGGVSS